MAEIKRPDEKGAAESTTISAPQLLAAPNVRTVWKTTECVVPRDSENVDGKGAQLDTIVSASGYNLVHCKGSDKLIAVDGNGNVAVAPGLESISGIGMSWKKFRAKYPGAQQYSKDWSDPSRGIVSQNDLDPNDFAALEALRRKTRETYLNIPDGNLDPIIRTTTDDSVLVIDDDLFSDPARNGAFESRQVAAIKMNTGASGASLRVDAWQPVRYTANVSPSEIAGRNSANEAEVRNPKLKIFERGLAFDCQNKKIGYFNMGAIGGTGKVDIAYFSPRPRTICRHPTIENVYYALTEYNADVIYQFTHNNQTGEIKKSELKLGATAKTVEDVRVNTSGHYLLIKTDVDLIAYDLADDKIIYKEPHHNTQSFADDGSLLKLDAKGHLEKVDLDFAQRRLFPDQARRNVLAGLERVYTGNIKKLLANANDLAKVAEVEATLRATFENDPRITVHAITDSEMQLISEEGRALIAAKIDQIASTNINLIVGTVQRSLAGTPTLATLEKAQKVVEGLRAQTRTAGAQIIALVQRAEAEVEGARIDFWDRAGVAEIQADPTLKTIKLELAGFKRFHEFQAWYDTSYPQHMAHLSTLGAKLPAGSVAARQAYIDLQSKCSLAVGDAENRLKANDAKLKERIREVAVKQAEQIRAEILKFLAGIRRKHYPTVADAENDIAKSGLKASLEQNIQGLTKLDSGLGEKMTQQLEGQISNFLYHLQRRIEQKLASGSEDVVFFGKIAYPVFEPPYEAPEVIKTNMVFSPAKNADGTYDEQLGYVAVHADNGTQQRVTHLHANRRGNHAKQLQMGHGKYRGEYIPATHMTGAQFKELKDKYAQWIDPNSDLRLEYEQRRDHLKEVQKRQPRDPVATQSLTIPEFNEHGERTGKMLPVHRRVTPANIKKYPQLAKYLAEYEKWKAEYKGALQEFRDFCIENNTYALRAMKDTLVAEKNRPFRDKKNYVPEWDPNWVLDNTTEDYLGTMADEFITQKKTGGCLMLEGHAGTGKDVLIKMFAERTNRPFFEFSGSRWTTESDLCEEIMLAAEDGAMKTIRVPSVIVKAIQIPGAVVYFNEFNAMPKPAQIFLHSLLDSKRSFTIKSSDPNIPNRVIRAAPDVLLAASMNKGYEGTEALNEATYSRMSPMQVDYVPLTLPPTKAEVTADPNAAPRFNPAEAMRMARGMPSLKDLTHDFDLSKNLFIKLWNAHINHDGDITKLDLGTDKTGTKIVVTPEMKFDLMAILTTLICADKFRESFIQLKKGKMTLLDGRTKTLPIKQPFTGRDMAKIAEKIGRIPASEKKDELDAAWMTKEIIKKAYVAYIDEKNRDEVINALCGTVAAKGKTITGWPIAKRA